MAFNATRELCRRDAVEVGLDGATSYLHPEDVDPVDDVDPWVSLLPSLDPTLGWKERDWYLDDLSTQLFDRNGNAGPTVWVDGRVVGGWRQRAGGEVVFDLLVDVGAEEEQGIAARAAELESWLGDERITLRFASYEKRIRAS